MAKLRLSKMFKSTVSHIFTNPATSLYPYVEPQLPEDSRGQPIFDFMLCVGCGLCSKDCPSQAIEIVKLMDTSALNLELIDVSFVINVLKLAEEGQ